MTSSPAQPTFVASPTLAPDAMHSLDPESPSANAGPSSTAAASSSSARKQRDRGTADKEKRSKKDKLSSKDKDKDKDKDPAQREARRTERERRKAARRSVTSVADSAAGGSNDADSVVPPTPLTPVTPTSLLGGPQQPRTRTVSGSSADLDADESVPLAVANSNANRRISRALSAISQQDVMSHGGNAYAGGNTHAIPSTLASSNGQSTPRTPVFPPTASAAQARRHSQLIAPPSGADDNLPLSVHRQSMILQEENLPIAVAQKRRSMYSDHRTNSVASFADLLSQHSGTHGGGMSSATLTGGSGGGQPPMYAPPTPGAFTPRSPSGSTFGQQGAYPMQQFTGGSQRGSMVMSPSAKPRKGSAQAHLPPPPVPQQQPQLSAFQQITRKLSGRRARGPPTASSSNSGSNPSGTHFADIESQASNTGFQRKRSLVRRDRAQHHGRTPSGGQQQQPTGTAHHHHRATLNGMRGNPEGPPGGGPNSSVPLPPNISRRPITLPREKDYSRPETACRKAWVVFSKIITFYAVSPLLAACGMPDPNVQQAWREKMALCTIIALLMAALAFLTFAFNAVLCQPSSSRLDSTKIGNGFVIVNGFALDVTNYNHNFQSTANNNFGQFPFWEMYGESQSRQNRDLSFMFQNQYAGLPECVSLFGPQYIRLDEYLFPCTIGAVAEDKGARKFGKYPASYCHKDTALLRSDVSDFTAKGKRRQLFVPWDQLENTQNDYLAFNGQVIDLSIIYRLKKPVNWSNLNGVNFEQVFKRYKNKDATMFMSSNATMSDAGKCLTKIARVGSLDSSTMGCIASDVVLWVSLLVILSLVLSRFFMAIIFRWVLAPKLGRRLTEDEKRGMLLMRNARERDASLFGGSSVGGGNGNSGNGSIGGTRPGSYMSAVISGTPGDRRSVWSQYDSPQQPPAFTSSPTSSPAPGIGFSDTISTLTGTPVPDSPKTNPAFGNETTASQRSSTSFDIQRSPRMMPLREPDLTKEEVMHTILLVTCYSEDEHGIRTTLDSLAATHYMDTHKLLFVIADGIIMGAGNDSSTPEIIVSMMEKDPTFPEVPKPYSYVAIADGAKRHNMAAVHAGYYNYEGHRVPMVVVVKCGGPEEKDLPKPGNRGKRDSQIVLMSFLQKVMFDERMTPLEYDLFQKIHKVARVTPDVYEMVLMVDADTKVAPDSVERMVACFARDHTVMGLCGETQIENKFGSWVTMIQVFEYYISHHLAKAFESVFGGVTCLPGCFCAYRIKTPKGEHGRHWVPILANPDIVDQYQENVVETLHEKNLFLLGEDRYLTTLMLKTFPKRKMLFVPQATCETTVPDQFSVLLSQRRRWINSTIHNLMELVLVKDLCGTFCISMQFVIAIELFGTLVLPAAICFTIYLLVISFFSDPVPIIPLLLLAAILGLPGLLIVFTTRKWQFLFWMVIYLLSLPVWNFILPTYAFWHFDDFSWGATRVVQGGKDGHDDDDGEFDSSKIIMKRYAEWEQIKQRAIAQALEAAAHQHQQAYRRAAQAQMQQYYGVDNQLVRSNGLEYTA